MLLTLWLACVFAQEYTKRIERVWDLTSQYNTQKSVSWGVNYESIYNKEKLWIKQDTTINFYDITDVTGTPQRVKQMQSGSECKNAGTFLIQDNKFMSVHGNDQYCTCEWSVENPCPHKLQISGAGIEYADKYQFYANTVLPVDQIVDVTGSYGMAQPANGCDPITNPTDVNGKWCVVYRGACFFQDKWDNCHNAGAIGTVVVTLDDSTGAGWQMWVESVTSPMIGIRASIGAMLNDTFWNGDSASVTLGAGKGIGVDAPDPEYSGHDPLVTINYYTGERTEDAASHFQTVQDLVYNQKSDMIHFVGVNGVGSDVQVYDSDQSPPRWVGEYNIDVDGNYDFIYRDAVGVPETVLYTLDAWAGEIKFWDMANETNPVFINSFLYESCDDDSDFIGFAVVHPNQNYMYLIPSIHVDACDYKIRLYDISSFANPTFITDIHIPEVDHGADIYSWTWALGNEAALSLSSSGVSWYDFADPSSPTPIAHLDLNDVEDTYTLGARSVRQLSDGVTWLINDETEFWQNFHAIRLVDPPAAGCATVEDGSDSDADTWKAIGIIFLVITILACLTVVFFFHKWNMEVNYKFQQFEEGRKGSKRGGEYGSE